MERVVSKSTGIRVYIAKKGRMREVWLTKEEQSAAARNPLGFRDAVIVGTDEHYSEAVVRTGTGGVRVKLVTRASAKMAEGVAWMGALQALAYVGEVGAVAMEMEGYGLL
jgi:hypothetical protein